MAGSRYAYVRNFELPDPLLPSTFFVIRIDGKGFHGFSKLHNFEKPNDRNALTLMNEAAKRVVGGRELNGECVLAFGESDEYRCVPCFRSCIRTASIPVADGSRNSFVFKRTCKLHGRRSRFVSLSLSRRLCRRSLPGGAHFLQRLHSHSKLVTMVVSIFSAAYVALWPQYFPNSPLTLEELPVFDGRCVPRHASPRCCCQDTDPCPASSVVQYTSEEEVRDYLRWRQVDSESGGRLSCEQASDLG